jgi:hypothetical protein
MQIYSDHEVADLALDIEEILDIDMNLEDMFSDDLNNYFDYTIDKSGDKITFFFEVDEGSCKLTVHNPFDDYERFSFNKILENLIKQKQI